MVDKNCKRCGKTFTRKGNNQSFCSRECFTNHRKDYNKIWETKHKAERDARAQSPERKKRRQEIATKPENKEKKATYSKKYKQLSRVKAQNREYQSRSEVRARNTAWQKKRLAEARKLLGGKCSVCGTKKELQFHHWVYKRSKYRSQNQHEVLKNPEDFELLCRRCHNVVTHALTDKKRAKLILLNIQKALI